ncbi:hypothetical protein SAY87_012333 [Trapa incisa]|uniref:AN1-type domain-containing protein n=1 Tax=Trapa incisa TaxID=236973 RepID=A0AAN7GHA6_9MYRT|nr:hypothetical protein SAY87_012333 [Trapa incisa]
MNLCSKCYKDIRLKDEQAATAKAAVKISLNAIPATVSPKDRTDSSSSISVAPSLKAPVVKASEVVADQERLALEQPKPKTANRCSGCHKKVGLMGFKCRCGDSFCGSHRYLESHNRTFDYKGACRDAIAKANPGLGGELAHIILSHFTIQLWPFYHSQHLYILESACGKKNYVYFIL